MPMAEVNLVPSVNVQTTMADNPSGIQESNFIRWRANLPEKRGGCTLFINPSNSIAGTPTDLQPWLGINGEQFLGIGTDGGLYVYEADQGALLNISPRYINSNGQTPPTFETTAGSPVVKVTDTAVSPGSASLTIYDTVVIKTPVSVGGLQYLSGTGSPSGSVTAPKGSIYLRTDGSATNNRMYVNIDGAGAWTPVTTAS